MKPDLLQSRFPGLMRALPRTELASLPTPVHEVLITRGKRSSRVWIKADDMTGEDVGGNKVRKLEYLFGQILATSARRVATYGTVASNHALATALTCRRLGLEATCFLAHQARTDLARQALGWHQDNDTEMLAFAGSRQERIALQRKHLWHRDAAVISAGGSSWRGSAGFINAGLELAGQVRDGCLPLPDRIYMAAGTMGSVAGLAIGLVIAGLGTHVEAVRVSHPSICNDQVLLRLCRKTCELIHRIDGNFPRDAWQHINVRLRHDYFAPGYARASDRTLVAMDLVAGQTDLRLEATYTGKAMAALLDDMDECARLGERQLFWNTYHALGEPPPVDRDRLPGAFLDYLAES